MRSGARLAAVLALSGCTSAGFRGRDWILQGSLAAVSAADAIQTPQITAAGAEQNPLVGPNGERFPFLVVGAVTLVAEALVARMLPDPYRLAFEGFALGAETENVTSNCLNGWYPW